MKKFDLKKAILENKATFHSSLNEAEGLTPLQDYVYQYEIEISGEDQAQEFLDDIKRLNTPDDVYDYYAYERDWQGSMDDDLENIYRQVKKKFSKLGEGYDEFKRADKGSKDVTAKDKGEEEVYGAGVKKGEEIEKKKMKEDMSRYFTSPPKTPTTLVDRIIYMYPKMKWLKDELPGWFTFQDVKGTLEDAGYGKVYDEFMGGDMGGRMTDLNETNTKMKKSDLKAKIKEMIVAEYEKDVDYTDENPEKEEDFLSEIAAMLDESPMNDPRLKQVIQMLIDMDVDGETMEYILRQVGMDDQMANQLVNYPAEYAASLKEADETEKDTAEVDTADVTVDDTETTDVETTAEVDPNVKAVQDSLTQAQAAAQALGDKKLIDQIGNTITFFTRAHVVEKPKAAGAVAESMFPMLNKILK